MRSAVACLMAVSLLSGTAAEAATAAERALARAKQAYNAGNPEGAIAAAIEARADPRIADAAAVVLARAYLERFRTGADLKDLDDARETLRTVQTARLAARDRLDLAVGLGEALYLDRAYGAAAQMFEPLLDAAAQLGPGTRERVVDWWASALDAEARERPASERAAYYRRIVERMDTELTKDTGASSASYWLAAGALGLGDVFRAWQTVIAGWVRASFAADRKGIVRADLDRLMLEAVIPERVKALPLPARDISQATMGLRNEWELVKSKWQ